MVDQEAVALFDVGVFCSFAPQFLVSLDASEQVALFKAALQLLVDFLEVFVDFQQQRGDNPSCEVH